MNRCLWVLVVIYFSSVRTAALPICGKLVVEYSSRGKDVKEIMNLARTLGQLTYTVETSNGDKVATMFADRIIVWDAESHQRIETFDNLANPRYEVEFSPDGQRIAFADDKAVYLGDLSSRAMLGNKFIGKYVYPAGINGVGGIHFSPQGKLVTSPLGVNTQCWLWPDASVSATLGAPEVFFPKGSGKQFGAGAVFAFSPDESELGTAVNGDYVFIWNISTKTNLVYAKALTRGPDLFLPSAIALSDRGGTFAVGFEGGSLFVFAQSNDPKNPRVLRKTEFDDGGMTVNRIDLSRDGKYVAVSTKQPSLYVLNSEPEDPDKPLVAIPNYDFGPNFSGRWSFSPIP